MFETWKAKRLVAGLAEDVPAAVLDQFRTLGDAGVDALISGLRHQRPEVRAGVARVLGELRPARAIGTLAACAGELPEAASALTSILSRSVRPRVFNAVKGADSGMVALVALLTSSDEAMRAEAEAALLREGPQSAAALAAALETEELREPALRVLSKTGPAGIPAVVPLLEHRRKEVREQAAAALQSFGWRPAGPGEEVALAAALQDWQRCRELGKACVERLTVLLSDADSEVRQAAARVLGSLKDPRAVPALVAALDDRKEAVRFAAVEALGEIGDEGAVEALVARLRSSYDLCAPALESLRRIGWTPGTAADRILVAVITGDKVAFVDPAVRRVLIQAACEQDYQLPEEVVLRGLRMVEDADAELSAVLRRGGRMARIVCEILNERRAAEDQHVLCGRCLAYLGLRKDVRSRGAHPHCGDCGAPVVL